MKTIVTQCIAAAMIFGGITSTASAQPYCGERYFVGYSHCGEPIWAFRPARPQYRPRCNSYRPPPRCYNGGYSRSYGNSYGGGYGGGYGDRNRVVFSYSNCR